MIRETYSDDHLQLLDIQTACIRGLVNTYSENEIRAWIGYINQEGASRYGRYENRVFEDEQGYIAGFVSWSQQETQSSIECLYTLPRFRNQGIGQILLEEAEANLRLGTTVHIRSTLNAVSFYEQNGYIRMDNTTSRAGFSISVLQKTLPFRV